MPAKGVPAAPLLGSEIDFVPLIIFTADEDETGIVIRRKAFGAVLTRPSATVRLAGGHPQLARVVGVKNEAEPKQLRLDAQSGRKPPRPRDDDLMRDHDSLRSWTGRHRLIVLVR